MPIYFGLYKILLMEKNFNSLEEFKRRLEQFFAQKDSLGKMELQSFLKKRQKVEEKKMVNMLFNKVLVENEKCVF